MDIGTSWDFSCPDAEPKIFNCEVCGYPFMKQWQLEVHRMTVAGSKWCR